MSSSSLSSSSSAELRQYRYPASSTSSTYTQSAPISYSSSALIPAHETASSCSLSERKTQLAARNIVHRIKDLPLDCIGNIFEYFSNEDYLAFSHVNSLSHNLIWNPSSIYLVTNFLANIVGNLHLNSQILKEEEFSPLTDLTFDGLTEENRKFFIEGLVTIAKPLIPRRQLSQEILSHLNHAELSLLIKFRRENSSFFEAQSKVSKVIRKIVLQMHTTINSTPILSNKFNELIRKVKEKQEKLHLNLTKAQITNRRADNVQGRVNQRGIRAIELPPRGEQQPHLEPNDQRTFSWVKKVQTVATLAFALFGFWCFIATIYGYCTDNNIRCI